MLTVAETTLNILYEQHLINLTLQGKRPAAIDGYSRAVRHNSNYFDPSPDSLTTANLKNHFNSLIQTHSWNTVKIDRNGLQSAQSALSIHVLNSCICIEGFC
ncbi:MAG: phage integrase N-terminal SAM-like domain-containing protein [Moritella sp.]|nr:phage integrase N-terminal SAM-like domain-containing protein [Moritella sp.]